MRRRIATFGAALGLALFGAGFARALSLRSSTAEASLGEMRPGAAAVLSKATGARLRVEDAGTEPVRVEFKVVPPSLETAKDGFEPWPYPDKVRLAASSAEIGPGQAAETDVTVAAPKDSALKDGQYEIDVLASGRNRAGESLTLKTRLLVSVGAPSASEEKPGSFIERPGFALSPAQAGPSSAAWETSDPGGGATFKIVNAADEDLTVSIVPARDWSEDARIPDGYEPSPNPRWLRFELGDRRIRAGTIGRARVWASVPRQKRYAGRHWAFVAAVDAAAGGRRTRRYFVLTADTPQWREDAQVR